MQKCEREFDHTEIITTNAKTKETGVRTCYIQKPTGKINYKDFVCFIHELRHSSMIYNQFFEQCFFNGYESEDKAD